MARRRYGHTEPGYRIRLSGIQCVYCGELATCLDHWPPLQTTASGLLLPACKECNNLAASNWPFDLERRANYVQSRLRWRYRKELGIPAWRPGELRKLREPLRRNINAWLEKQKIARRRTAWSAVGYLACIDQSNVFAALAAVIDGTPVNERPPFERLMQSLKNSIG